MIKKDTIFVKNMLCDHCNDAIEKAVSSLEGIVFVKADYVSGKVNVEYEDDKCDNQQICGEIEKSGYLVQKEKGSSIMNGISIGIITLSVLYILNITGVTKVFQYFPEAKEGMGYMTICLIGIFTSVHCIAMCGGFNLAQSMVSKGKAIQPSILYNLGRVISYTFIGGLLGGLGSIVAISLKARAVMGIVAGVVMIIMALNMLGCFKGLKKVSVHLPSCITKRMYGKKSHGSFYIGLVNGLMPCGPLQSMQILAIASGSVIKGALSMFFFSVGTVPLMLLLGIFAGSLKNKFKERMMLAGAVFVMLFGLFTLNNNLVLSGIGFPEINQSQDSMVAEAMVDHNIQYITTNLQPGSFERIKVKKNIPVKWTIVAGEGSLNGCNNEIVISEYHIDMKLKQGENIIEFTPKSEGEIQYSCWMGMIKSSILVES